MSETWRVKGYYRPRVLISTGDVLDCPYPDSLICLTGAQLVILRNLTQYLHRRSTFVSEYRDSDYLAPSNAEWDALDAVVADLEINLMGCPEILAKLQCICDAILALRTIDALPVDSVLTDQPLHDDYSSPVVEDTGDPPTGWLTWSEWKIQKCKSAQKAIDDTIETMGKMAVVSASGGVLTVVALLATFVFSAIIPPLAIVMLAATSLATLGLASIQAEARTWISEHKQGLVCSIFNAATAGEAHAALESYADANWDVEGSPVILLYILNFYLLSNIFDGTMPEYETWEGEYSAGYCVACSPPVVGTDWYAWPLNPDTNTVILDHPAGPYWVSGCWQGSVPTGEMCQGVVFKTTVLDGGCFAKCMSANEAGCEGSQLWDNTSEGLGPLDSVWFAVNPVDIDEVECKATLCPGAMSHPDTIRRAGPLDINGGFHAGFDCTGHIELTFLYQVFRGSPPG